jgi:ElaB/YqjD/DUF883 family membrane-anchored ribosome-binding protein
MTRSEGAQPGAGGLALLVETEDRLEAMLASRREEAARLLAEARGRAQRRLASLNEEIAARAARLEQEIGEGAEAAVREAALEGERRSAPWLDVPDHRLDSLVGDVLERLLDTIGGPP